MKQFDDPTRCRPLETGKKIVEQSQQKEPHAVW